MNELVLPVNYHAFLKEFILNVLQDKPNDLVDYAANYFSIMNSTKVDSNGLLTKLNSIDLSDGEEFIRPPVRGRGRRTAVAGESYDPTKETDEEVVTHPKDEEQIACLKNAVKNILLFKACSPDQLSIVLGAMFERSVIDGDVVIKQGDDGDNFYVIQEGKFDIFVNDSKEDKCVAQLDGKGSFGELALLYNCPRAATIIARSKGTLWCLDQKTFRKLIVTAAAKRRLCFENLLESVPLFAELTPYERMNLADALDTKTYNDKDCIIREGDEAENMFFIMEGSVSITVKDKNHHKDEKEVAIAQKGQYFGELALIMKKPRVASVYAIGRATCAVLDVAAFERLLGPCVEILKRNINVYEKERKRLGIAGIQ